jgi:hypothetical protein
LPFDRIAEASGIDWDILHRQVRFCQQLYPGSHTALASLLQKLESLSAETGSPFIAPLESLHGQSGGLSVLLRNPRFNQAVAEFFTSSSTLQNATVISARQLQKAQMCDVLVAIGSCMWFPDYVFSAPRAAQIHVVSFRWIRDPWKPGPVFLHGADSSAGKNLEHYVGALPQLRSQTPPRVKTMPYLRPMDLLPPLPHFGTAGSRIAGGQPHINDDTILARLCHMSGNRAVFVSFDEGASSLVIDTKETGNSILRRVPADELEPELYLLLRTSGGGDFIAPLANRILGSLAAERRSQQAEWKDRLVTAAQNRFGTLTRRELAARLASDLRMLNLSEVRPANVFYWMSSKCIHPRNEEAFAAILAFAGLADRTQELWAAMGEIYRAHKRAGQVIRKMLLHKILTSSLMPLERDGEMTFDLGEKDGGTISAFQIMGISNEEFEIPADHIGILLDSEE